MPRLPAMPRLSVGALVLYTLAVIAIAPGGATAASRIAKAMNKGRPVLVNDKDLELLVAHGGPAVINFERQSSDSKVLGTLAKEFKGRVAMVAIPSGNAALEAKFQVAANALPSMLVSTGYGQVSMRLGGGQDAGTVRMLINSVASGPRPPKPSDRPPPPEKTSDGGVTLAGLQARCAAAAGPCVVVSAAEKDVGDVRAAIKAWHTSTCVGSNSCSAMHVVYADPDDAGLKKYMQLEVGAAAGIVVFKGKKKPRRSKFEGDAKDAKGLGKLFDAIFSGTQKFERAQWPSADEIADAVAKAEPPPSPPPPPPPPLQEFQEEAVRPSRKKAVEDTEEMQLDDDEE